MLMVVLIALAAACFTIGLLVGKIWLVWCALAASVLGALAVGVVLLRLRKGETVDAGAAATPTATRESADAAEGDPATGAIDESAGKKSAIPETSHDANETSTSEDATPSTVTKAAEKDGPITEQGTTATRNALSSPSQASNEAPALNGDLTVRVIPGRRRFHVADCRLTAGKTTEEISLEEAQEEGFSACTTCIPRREVLTHSD
jgi:hypothetical protein